MARSREVYPIPDQPYASGSTSHLAPASSHNSNSHPSTTPIIIDNGSTTLRAGYAVDPNPSLIVDNLNSRYRDRKTNRTIMLAGQHVYADAASRSNIKSPHENDVVVNFDVMENMLDYVFHQLNISSSDASIDHPIIMTEALGNPHYARSLMSELLFEGYNTPSVAYGIDSLFAFHQSPSTTQDGLVISSSTSSTHVIPVLGGKAITSAAKKLNWGGSHASEYMLKLMQLKYPTFPGRLSSFQAGCIYRQHCYVSEDYRADLQAMADPVKMVDVNRIVQFPFIPPIVEEKTEEELAKAADKKKESGRRLQEQVQKQRSEKMARQEEELLTFGELRASKANGRRVDFEKRLKAAGFISEEDLDEYLKKVEKSLTKARNKDLGIVEDDQNKEPPVFPLVDVPDHTLNEADLKEKRRQRLMKAGYDARIRMKAEKEQENLIEQERRRLDDEKRITDFEGWIGGMRKEHEVRESFLHINIWMETYGVDSSRCACAQDVMNKIKEGKKRRQQLGDRKSLAAQNRMKNIANLASDANTPGGGGGPKKRKRTEQDDGFGKNDDDWAVYREIGPADDSDDEEDDQIFLEAIEARLLQHDPNFSLDDTAVRLAQRRHRLLNAFVRGLAPDDPLDTYDPESIEHNSQLHLNVERIRVPEVVWQPGMAGVDQAGLGEILENALRGYPQEVKDRLTNNIFVTGGNTLTPQFDTRLRATLRPILSVAAPLNIVRAAPDSLDSWRGMAKWSQGDGGGDSYAKARITRAEYQEYGADWFKGHEWGNWP
ncbi:BQ5605_C007g04619 [Microbotryum silenes-dioicae]|uniref:BQ5605_C007g04619 protein n=1 Tax=Microbotryum silenes-dioicae TaxID=796604 RepID=A0A2X0MUN7_9BASI|nr:BQ5605_C007g04619 [Microbotryum silenes-dioicae]